MDIRESLREFWQDTCDIYEYQEVAHTSGRTSHEPILVLADIPCRLSYNSQHPVNQTATIGLTPQSVKIFLCETVPVKAGSKIIVKRGGKELDYGYSGKPALYEHHQEITLSPSRGRA